MTIIENPTGQTPNPNGFKKTDWLLLFLGLAFVLVTFPILGRVYRILIPLVALGVILFFAFRFTQLGRILGPQTETVYPNVSILMNELIGRFKKYFRRIAFSFLLLSFISLLGILWYTNYSKYGDTQVQLDKIAFALQKTKNDSGQYPTNLIELIGNNPLRREWKKDKWGNPIQYTKQEGTFTLVSAGKDGRFGNADDIVFTKD